MPTITSSARGIQDGMCSPLRLTTVRRVARLRAARPRPRRTGWPHHRGNGARHSQRAFFPFEGWRHSRRNSRRPSKARCRRAASTLRAICGSGNCWPFRGRRERGVRRGIAEQLDRARQPSHLRSRDRHQHGHTHRAVCFSRSGLRCRSARGLYEHHARPHGDTLLQAARNPASAMG
jgi:hypothetical protein